jgi:hypothetical protein
MSVGRNIRFHPPIVKFAKCRVRGTGIPVHQLHNPGVAHAILQAPATSTMRTSAPEISPFAPPHLCVRPLSSISPNSPNDAFPSKPSAEMGENQRCPYKSAINRMKLAQSTRTLSTTSEVIGFIGTHFARPALRVEHVFHSPKNLHTPLFASREELNSLGVFAPAERELETRAGQSETASRSDPKGDARMRRGNSKQQTAKRSASFASFPNHLPSMHLNSAFHRRQCGTAFQAVSRMGLGGRMAGLPYHFRAFRGSPFLACALGVGRWTFDVGRCTLSPVTFPAPAASPPLTAVATHRFTHCSNHP